MAIYPLISIGKTGARTLNIINSQNIPTQTGLQVMWQVPVSTLQTDFPWLNSNLSNLRFVYNGQFVPAWLESINNGTATIWIKMPVSIPANSSITLNLYSNSTLNFDGIYWGEAPQLSPTYGQYDNGASMFNFYDNFAGTTLSSKWVANGASYTINNGLTYTSSQNYNVLVSATSFTSPYIIDYYGKGTASSEDGGVFFNVQGTGVNANCNLWAQRGSSGSQDAFYVFTAGVHTKEVIWSYSIDGNMHVYTLVNGPSNNPLITQTDYSTKETFTSMPSTYSSGYFGPRDYVGTTYWQWVRVRAYPPNGVMPTVELM
jgi:hypothetical protein